MFGYFLYLWGDLRDGVAYTSEFRASDDGGPICAGQGRACCGAAHFGGTPWGSAGEPQRISKADGGGGRW